MDFIIVFILGLVVGSFMNSLVYRLNEGGTVFSFKTRSFCPACKHALYWIDLIPLASFIVLRGKCRFCRNPISPWYVTGEISGGIFFLAIWFFLKFIGSAGISARQFNVLAGAEVVYIFILGALLLGIFVSDFRYFTIPDIFVLMLFLLAFGAIIVQQFSHPFAILPSLLPSFWMSIAGGVIGFSFFFSFVFFSHEKWMGWGDVKYGALMGLLLGWPRFAVGLYLAFIMGALIGLVLIGAKQKTLKSEIPFGTFLVPATLIALFEGEKLWCMIWPC